MNLELRMKN